MALALAAPAATSALADDSIYVPLFTYRTGPFAGSGTPIADGMHDYLAMLNERDGGIGGVKLVDRRMRDRLRHQEGLGMLRLGQAQEPGDRQSLVDRHHVVADPQGVGRQDPDPVDGLRPFGLGQGRRLSLDLQSAGDLLGRRVGNPQVCRRRLDRQSQGQDHRLSLFRRRLRPGADSVLPVGRQRGRLQSEALSRRARRHAEPVVAMARHPPRQARFRGDVRLGRDEPDRDQGGGQTRASRWTSSSPSGGPSDDDAAAARRRRQGLQGAQLARHRDRLSRLCATSRNSSSTPARARRRPESSVKFSTTAASTIRC